MTLGGIPLEVSARINHCHTPIDVTFLVQSETTILKNFTPDNNNNDDDDGGEESEPPVEVIFFIFICTVKPVYNDHPRDLKKWSICRGDLKNDEH